MILFRKVIATLFMTGAIGFISFSTHQASHSPLFTLQVLEINFDGNSNEEPPIDIQTVSQLAALPIGSVNLFDLRLNEVESRIRTNAWIKEVKLVKTFPQTLSIAVSFKKPIALFQSNEGFLNYIDSSGAQLGGVNLTYYPDLPILSLEGVPRPQKQNEDINRALSALRNWELAPIAKLAEISSMKVDGMGRLSAVVIYRSTQKPQTGAAPPFRTFLELGSQETDDDYKSKLTQLTEVFRYLRDHSIPVRQVWADSGKKIVVKSALGS